MTVTGNAHESATQVIDAAGLAGQPPLLDVDAGATAARIEQLPWVRSASVSVSWPDGVHIRIDRGDAAFRRERGRRALGEFERRWPGPRGVGGPRGRAVAAHGAAATRRPGAVLPARDDAGLDVASTLPASFAAQVTGVTVEPAGWVQLSMTTPIAVDIGTATQLTAKYEDVSSILAGATLHNGDVIDVSVPDAPTVTGP